MNKLIRVIFNADLRCSHDGLTKLAKSVKVSTTNLEVGEFVAFINAKKSMIKLFASNNTIAHWKNPSNRRMELGALALIPKYFNGSELQYDKALKEHLENKFKRK